MNKTEALDWIEKFESNLISSSIFGPRVSVALEALSVCREAIRSSEIKLPVRYNVRRGALCPSCDGELYTRALRCGIFRKEEIKIEEKAPFCKWCGQALSWTPN